MRTDGSERIESPLTLAVGDDGALLASWSQGINAQPTPRAAALAPGARAFGTAEVVTDDAFFGFAAIDPVRHQAAMVWTSKSDPQSLRISLREPFTSP